MNFGKGAIMRIDSWRWPLLYKTFRRDGE